MSTNGNITTARYSGNFHSTLDIGQTKAAVRLGAEDFLAMPSRVGSVLRYRDGSTAAVPGSAVPVATQWGKL